MSSRSKQVRYDPWRSFRQGSRRISWLGRVQVCRREVGELVLPTGRLVACDPLAGVDPKPFMRPVPAGRYPVCLSVVHLESDQRVAAARVQFVDERPVSWIPAVLPRQNEEAELPPAESFGYPVDSGTGCFMDDFVARKLRRLTSDEFIEFTKRAFVELEKKYIHTWGWLNVVLDQETGANLIAFSTGFGDGRYATSFGLSAGGVVVCVVSDFLTLDAPPPAED